MTGRLLLRAALTLPVLTLSAHGFHAGAAASTAGMVPVSGFWQGVTQEKREAPAQDGGASKNDDDSAEPAKLTEAEEKALKEVLEKALKRQRPRFKEALEKLSKELVSKRHASEDAGKKLEALIPGAVDAAVSLWTEKAREWILDNFRASGDMVANLKEWAPENLNSVIAIDPSTTAVWKDGLKGILPAEQLAALEAEEKARVEKFRKEMGDYLANSEAQAQETFAASMDQVLGRVERLGNIDEERMKKLRKAADEAVKATAAEWRTRAEMQLMAMDESSRSQMASGGGYMGVSSSDRANQPRMRKVWREAEATILTTDERKQITEVRQALRLRRADALGQVLVSELDRLLGFDDKQRTALSKLAAPLMTGLPAYYFDTQENGGYYALDAGQMMGRLKDSKDKLKEILDERQMKRWDSLSPENLSRGGVVRETMDFGKLPPAEEMNEVDSERFVSAFLHREARKMKRRMFSIMESRVDVVIRAAPLPQESVAQLNTAAKGAAEQMSQVNISNLTSWVRGQCQNAKPADVISRLQNLYNPYSIDRQQQADVPVWTSTVERLLSGPQREALKKDVEERDAWRGRAIAEMTLTEIEKRISLKQAQVEPLRKKIQETVLEYETEFTNYFSTGWYLQGYYSMIPAAMITEKEWESLLEKKQAETVREKCLGHTTQYVEMIRRNHDSRTGKKAN